MFAFVRLKLSGAACYKEKSISRQISIHPHPAHPASHNVRSHTQHSFHITSQPLLNPNFSLASPTNKMKTSFSTLLFAFSLTGRYVFHSHQSLPPSPFSTTTNPNRALADLHQNAVCVDSMDAGVNSLPSQTYSIPLNTLRMSSTKQQQSQLAATTS
jgi:hypothetical protein